MSAPKSKRSEVRTNRLLNEREQEFVASRRNVILQNLRKLQIQCSQREVPNIALLGSGGGQRAMVGLLGCLDQLDKAGLLDCILYLSGVSGSTWCMASLYKEQNWSTKLETVKDNIVKRLSGPGVSWEEQFAKLKKYYSEKVFFNLTDFWAAIVVTSYVKEIDEHTLAEQWSKNSRDPFPIYTVIDKQCKQSNDKDLWFEINPYEAGYSLTGAFVDTCDFSSQFENGSKKNHQGQFDMLYLQGLCGSAFADGQQNKEEILKWISEFFHKKEKILEAMRKERPEREHEETTFEFVAKHPAPPSEEKYYQVLVDLADMNLAALNGKDTSGFDRSINANLNDLSGGRDQDFCSLKKVETFEESTGDEKQDIKSFTTEVCNNLSGRINFWLFKAGISIFRCLNDWIWGRKYNFLHNMTGGDVPPALSKDETRDYEDAGLKLNSPYFSVLRKERDVDLIISLDFSQGDPFMTVREAAKMCKEKNIPFPEVNTANEDKDKPKDFYVFKGKNAPTVIHIPLFNKVNCGDEVMKWRGDYSTVHKSYSAEEIAALMKVAGKNISNNKNKLTEEIRAAIGKKRSGRFMNLIEK